MSELHSLEVPNSILHGLMFPNVTSIKMMQRATGSVKIITRAALKRQISKKLFEAIFTDIDLTGEYKTDNYHAIVHDQDRL